MQITRHPNVFDNIDRRANDERWNALGFELPCNQTHGLVANGSQRDKERDIDRVFSTQAEDLRRVDLFGVTLRIVGRHRVEALA